MEPWMGCSRVKRPPGRSVGDRKGWQQSRSDVAARKNWPATAIQPRLFSVEEWFWGFPVGFRRNLLGLSRLIMADLRRFGLRCCSVLSNRTVSNFQCTEKMGKKPETGFILRLLNRYQYISEWSSGKTFLLFPNYLRSKGLLLNYWWWFHYFALDLTLL